MRNMKTFLRTFSPWLAAGATLLFSQLPGRSQPVLFSDNFDTDTSANWDVFNGSADGIPDYFVQFGFDYSTTDYTSNGVTKKIPPAPSGSGSKGVKMWVNKDDNPAIAAVSIYPKGKSFSGEFALKFDMWLNYNGGAYGGTGSTEFGTFGIDHAGDKVNWEDGSSASDGVWFGVTGEGGAAYDYRAYAGDGFGPAATLPHSVWLDRDGDGVPEDEIVGGSEPPTYPLNLIFPAPDYESMGMPGKHWVQVEIRQRTNDVGGHVVTLLMNNYVFAQHEYGDQVGMTSGTVMLGNMDIFSSIANPKQDNYVLYDNLSVVDLTGVAPLPVVTVVTNDGYAAEPADPGSYTVTRFGGNTTAPLTVNYRMAGAASNGVDYVKLPGAFTFAAGQTATNIVLTPINDNLGEPDEQAIFVLVGGTNYDLYTNIAATVTIADDNDVPVAGLRVLKPVAYEGNPNNEARVAVELANPSATSLTINYQVAGTAVAGTDYTPIGSSVVIPAGETNAILHIRAINNDVQNSSERNVSITLASGTGYTLGSATNATVSIRDDEFIRTGALLYSEDFDTDHSANWTVNNSSTDGPVDLYFDYSTVGVPLAPHSTSATRRGAKLQANLISGTFGGVSISPTGLNITNQDYVLRFDLWQNFNGPLPDGGSGSTQISGGGIGTAGTSVQYPGAVDGIWFATAGDGGSSVDYRAYGKDAPSGYTEASGVFAAGTGGTARNNTDPYYAEFGGESAPAEQVALYPSQAGATYAGAQGFVWRDIVVAKSGDVVKWYIDGKLIATVNGASTNLAGGDIVLLHSDINAGSSADPNAPAMAFGLFDNVRVYALATEAAPIRITDIRMVNTDVQLTFAAGQSDTAADFKVNASGVATGPYAPVTASVSQLSPGTFKAVLPQAGNQQFYKIGR